MKWILPTIVLAAGFCTAAYADCPEMALKRDCSDESALQHIYKEHCNLKTGKSEFHDHYCKDLAALCTYATTNGVEKESGSGECYTKKDKKLIGWDTDGNATSCYKTAFEASGFGSWVLKTMFPVKDNKC